MTARSKTSLIAEIGPGTQPAPQQFALRCTGLVLLLVATSAMGMLVHKHFGGHVPGCGPRSACDALEATRWGKVPGLGWPTSFVGAAYFPAVAVAWAASRGRLGRALRWIARLGTGASLVLVGVMIALQKFCPYCAAAHAANLLFVLVAELGPLRVQRPGQEPGSMQRPPPRKIVFPRPALLGAATFVLVTGGLVLAQGAYNADRARRADRERAEFVQNAANNAATSPQQPADRWGASGFTGRYRIGPESAPIRIVILTDYQCPDCKRIEGEIDQVLASRTDVSLSVKHFPMCLDCNKHAGRTLHRNACWAARAAEAAGILGGDEGFFKMHRWLFEVNGLFETQEQLNEGLAKLGFDPASFTPVMNSPETLRRIQADIEDGIALGLYYTPMVFINGIELKWHFDPTSSVSKTVADLAARSLPARTSAADRPPLAAQKYVEDWQQQPARPLPADQRAWTLTIGTMPAGSGTPVEVVLFGDYQEPTTAAADKDIRAALAALPASGPGARYTFRHYPVNKACNPALPAGVAPEAVHALACRAALAAEAAGSVGGNEAYWKMHGWLLQNQTTFNEDGIRAAAAQIGLDHAALLTAMDKPEAARAIADDCRAAQQLGLTAIPMVFINGRFVPRPLRPGDNVLRRIIETAASAK